MNKDQIEKILKEKDINPTAIRLLVLKFFLKLNTAISLSELESNFDYSDRTTLFRTLKTFEKKGLLHTINDGNTTSYALCTNDCSPEHHIDKHIHFCCTICKKIFCLSTVKTPNIEIPSKFTVEKINIITYGICDRCSEKSL